MKAIPKSFEISRARIEKGLSMRKLAQMTNLNIGTISNIESKSKPVHPATAKKLCESLNLNFEQIFELSGQADQK